MIFYSDQLIEVLNQLNKHTCIGAITGFGKSSTITEFVKRNKNKRFLLIVGTILEQKTFSEQLDDSIYKYWNGEHKLKFKEFIKEYRLHTCLSITKQKFLNILLFKDRDFLESFDYIFYDEFASLNPCLANDMVNDLSEIQKYNKKVINYKDVELFRKLETLYMDIKNNVMDILKIGSSKPLYNNLIKIDCSNDYKEKAIDIFNNIFIDLEDDGFDSSSKLNLHISTTILLILTAPNFIIFSFT